MYIYRNPLSFFILYAVRPFLLTHACTSASVLRDKEPCHAVSQCHACMHARIAAHNGRARSSIWPWPAGPSCGPSVCATRACVMRCVRARKDYSRRCLGRRGKARRRRGMIRAPCVTRARPAGRQGEAQAGPWVWGAASYS